MGEDGQTPQGRAERNLERLYRGAAAGLGWLVQPLAWLADLANRDRQSTARWWHQNYIRPVFWLAVPLTPFWLVLIGLVGASLVEQLVAPIPAEPVERRSYFYGIGLTITGLGALLAAPFILIKTWVNERNTTAAEQGLITERFTRAVGQLGAEKSSKYHALQVATGAKMIPTRASRSVCTSWERRCRSHAVQSMSNLATFRTSRQAAPTSRSGSGRSMRWSGSRGTASATTSP